MSTATLHRPTARPTRLPAGLLRCDEPFRPYPSPPARSSRPQAPRALAPRASRVRLTRRGRLLLTLVGAVLLLVAISIGRTGSQAATATENGPTLSQTTVQPGDTLWTVAQRIAPHNDPREVVDQIRRINHLHTSSLRAGEQLLLPSAG
jgi:Tfp pilus assembly protein FimV